MIPESLIADGKRLGYLTYSQLNEFLPDDAIKPDKLMELLHFLEENRIDLIDESEVEQREMQKEEKDRERRFFLNFIYGMRSKLALIRQCKTTPATLRLAKGNDLRWECGRVYLMEKMVLVGERPNRKLQRVPNPVHKIGKTDRKWKDRSRELWRKHWLTGIHIYPTVIAFALEMALHRHFDHFRVRRPGERQKGQRKNLAGERFRLPQEEVDKFPETVASVEAWVLQVEEARLELELLSAPFAAGKLGIKPEELLPK